MRMPVWLVPKQPWAHPSFGHQVLPMEGSSQAATLSTQILLTGMLLSFSIVMELLLLAMCELHTHVQSSCVVSITPCVVIVFVVLYRPEPVVWNGTKLYFRWVKREVRGERHTRNFDSVKTRNIVGMLLGFCPCRGWRILQEVLTALMASGMSNASEVILTGCSGRYIDVGASLLTIPFPLSIHFH